MKISFSKQTKERAFKQLYEEYYAPFCLYAKRFVDDKETREDIVSDVFTSLWDKLDTDSFNLQSNTALAYIKMCVKNSCLNFLKHQEYEWSYAENIQKKAPVYETEPDSVYTLDELYRMLYETLDKLPENYRTVFMKSFMNWDLAGSFWGNYIFFHRVLIGKAWKFYKISVYFLKKNPKL